MSGNDTSIPVNIVGFGVVPGKQPIVIVGPNGVGKSQAMRNSVNPDRFVSAQRKTFLSDRLSSYSSEQLTQELHGLYANARNSPWAQTNEVDALFSGLISEDYDRLRQKQDVARGRAIDAGAGELSTLDTMVDFWETVFPGTRLTFREFTPRVYKLLNPERKYPARSMSDGERACLYLAARILTTSPGFIVIDEPELHLHKRLAVNYWDELERIRPDLRFIYITHDLHFALSRGDPTILALLPDRPIEHVQLGHLPSTLAEQLLGAATLSVNAGRFVFFEGREGSSLANRLMQTWINSSGSIAIPAANLRQVVSATKAFSELPLVANAKIEGLVDRDHAPAEFLESIGSKVRVLDLHEIESVFALPEVIGAVASVYGNPGGNHWVRLTERVRATLRDSLPKAVAERARARIDQLLRNSFTAEEIRSDLDGTRNAHKEKLVALDFPNQFSKLFEEERERILSAIQQDGVDILKYVSGKSALAEAATVLGVSKETYVSTVLGAISDPSNPAHAAIVTTLSRYLPER
ncbi:MAG TPA: AAA family ATPase [Tahibacter sp.]|nr:AAA family ATPase [Tahibacter sp.]